MRMHQHSNLHSSLTTNGGPFLLETQPFDADFSEMIADTFLEEELFCSSAAAKNLTELHDQFTQPIEAHLFNNDTELDSDQTDLPPQARTTLSPEDSDFQNSLDEFVADPAPELEVERTSVLFEKLSRYAEALRAQQRNLREVLENTNPAIDCLVHVRNILAGSIEDFRKNGGHLRWNLERYPMLCHMEGTLKHGHNMINGIQTRLNDAIIAGNAGLSDVERLLSTSPYSERHL